jgi:3-deoxy-D-manno-octulosonic-acid transferase
MKIIYQIGIALYVLAIRIAANFNPKAKLWLVGRKNIFERIALSLGENEKRIWFHYASLGEFEQGRPVQEAIRAQYPDHKLVMTFFSPSGYEAKKTHAAADYVFYLPMDGAKRSKQFIELINPTQAYFTKYEFWYFYFQYLAQKNIPLFLISGIFRNDQIFFKWYGGFFRQILTQVRFFFVQNESSKNLLNNIGIDQVLVTGDTRFDRVAANAAKQHQNAIIEQFVKGNDILLGGSTWSPDEKIIASLLNKNNFKFIIAPHEIKESRLQEIEATFNHACIRYSQANVISISAAKILIIDNIGMLSSLYQYASIAYIGGGFGVGIHNTLEAAAFGKPVIFGPNYNKFEEAKQLIAIGAAKSIHNAESFIDAIDQLYLNEKNHLAACEKSRQYIASGKGASEKIIAKINALLNFNDDTNRG